MTATTITPELLDQLLAGSGNSRNGTSSKSILTEDGEIEITVPRDRAGSFEPQLIAKGQTRFDGFDDKILSLYARGMTAISMRLSCLTRRGM